MAKIKIVATSESGVHTLQFLCPACKFESGEPRPHNISWKKDSDSWTFDENYEAPSITPSIALTGFELNEKGERVQTMCHTWITKGKVKFFGDCTHEMKGQKWIDLPDLKE